MPHPVVMVVPVTVPAAIMAHLGAGVPAAISMMVPAVFNHDGFGAGNRRHRNGKRAERRKNQTKLLHLLSSSIERE
ncbi:hypothetical protein UP09_11415 [Bradyrhizobium sp. LTSP885]|nr:hypothetical protein UP09_11415 [Bradyrhizobium sp. LTSP885]